MRVLVCDLFNIFDTKWNGSGVYAWRGNVVDSSITNPLYIGSSRNLRNRFNNYTWRFDFKKGHNPILQNYYRAHGGLKSLSFLLIEECDSEICREREQYWLDTLRPFRKENRGFNICWKTSKYVYSPPSLTTKELWSKQRKGVKFSPERLKRHTIAMRKVDRKGEKHPLFGKPRSDEEKTKIKENNAKFWTGKIRSVEDKLKMSGPRPKARGINNLNSIKVIAECDDKLYYFDAVHDAARSTIFDKLVSATAIVRCCKNKVSSAGKINGQRVKWSYNKNNEYKHE